MSETEKFVYIFLRASQVHVTVEVEEEEECRTSHHSPVLRGATEGHLGSGEPCKA